MAELLRTLGVPEHDIIVEDQSRNTFENARESARLLRSRGLARPALVTEATHLARSVLVFRAQGVDVIAAGVNYRVSDLGDDWLHSFLPDAGAASTVRLVTHEWVGMLWYWLRDHFDTVPAGG